MEGSALDDILVNTNYSCWKTDPDINQSTDRKVLRYVHQLIVFFLWNIVETLPLKTTQSKWFSGAMLPVMLA